MTLDLPSLHRTLCRARVCGDKTVRIDTEVFAELLACAESKRQAEMVVAELFDDGPGYAGDNDPEDM